MIFDSAFTGADLEEFEEVLRHTDPEALEFNNDLKRNVQVVFDENYVNLYALHLFHSQNMFSLTEFLLNCIPDEHQDTTIGTFIKAIF